MMGLQAFIFSIHDWLTLWLAPLWLTDTADVEAGDTENQLQWWIFHLGVS
jgi:hypothetical protein